MRQIILTSVALLASALMSTAALADTLERIRSSGTLRLGYRDASFPLSYLDDKGQPVGYHMDVCRRVAESVRNRLGLKALQINYQPVSSQNRLPLVTGGTIDLECGSTTHNLARQNQVAFAPTTFVSQVRFAVKKSSGINSLEQLNGKPVATTQGSTSVQWMRAHEKGRGLDFKEVYGKDHAESFQLLESDRAAAFVMDDILLAGLIAQARNPDEFAIVGEALSIEPIAIALRRDDAPFEEAVKAAIGQLAASGELEVLYKKWFMSPTPPKGINLGFPMNDLLRELIRNPASIAAETYNRKPD